MDNRTKIVIIALLSTLGCSQKAVQTPELLSAQSAYITLKKDEQVVTDASMEFFKAGKIYQMSKMAKTDEEAKHLAFLLENQLEIAKEKAKTKELQSSITKLKDRKTQALLQEKQNQIVLMQQEAQKAKLEAELSKKKLQELQELNAKQTNRGLVLTLGDVLFESGKSNLLSGAMRTIDKLVTFLLDNPKRMVLIEGHTADVGTPTFNLDLSLRRALAVQEALISKDIISQRLFIKGYGDAYPVASNSEASGRQRNRRVEIVILEEGVDPSSMAKGLQTQ